MGGDRFDELTRSLSSTRNRRGLLKTVGGVLAATAGFSGTQRSGRAALCRGEGQICLGHGNCCTGFCGPKDRTGRRQCGCPSGATACGSSCVDLQTDPSACGTCGVTCQTGASCIAGDCKAHGGDACTVDADCFSNACISGLGCQKNTGRERCIVDRDCGSGVCVEGTCAVNPAGGSCLYLSDCSTQSCTAGVCDFRGLPASAARPPIAPAAPATWAPAACMAQTSVSPMRNP